MENTIIARLCIVISLLSLTLTGCSKKTSEEHLIAAQQFIAAENIPAAVLELKNALQIDPNSAQARFQLGKIYLEQKDFPSAEKELNRALELGYSPAEIVPMLSQAYNETGASNALADVSHSDDNLSSADKAKVGYYKVVALVDLNKLDEAEQLIYELQDLSTQSVYYGLVQAYLPILDEQYEQSLDSLKALRKQAPLNEDVLKLLSRMHLVLGEKEQAADVLEQLSSIRTDSIEIQFTYLVTLMDLQRFEQAHPLVDKLLLVDAENATLNQFKGTILAEQDNFAEALSHLKKAIANGRDNPAIRLIAGFSAYRVEDFEQAVGHLSQIADLLPGEHPALRILADSQLKLGQNQQASETILGLAGRTQNDAALFSRAGFQLIQEGDIEVAKQLVEQGSEISDTTEELLRLGVLKLSLNDVSGLLKLEEAAAQAPESTVTQQTLASAYLLAGQFDKAQALATKWKEQQPQAFEPYLLSGELAQRNKQFDIARQEYEKAKGLATDSELPKLALANLTLAEGEVDEAIRQFKGILDAYPNSITALSMYFTTSLQQGDVSDAIERTKTALATQADNISLQLLLARMYFQQQKFSDALSLLNQIDGSDKDNRGQQLPVLYWQMKGQALLRTNRLDEAEKHYQSWLDNAPFNKDALLGVLLIKDLNNDFESALLIAERYAQKREDIQVNVLRAYFNVYLANKEKTKALLAPLSDSVKQLPFVRGINAQLALLEGRFADAIDDAKAAYTDRQNIKNLVRYMRALEGTQQFDNAYAVIEQFTSAFPNDPRAKLLLADKLISRNKTAAIKQYEDTLNLTPNNFLALNNLAYLYFEQGKYDQALPLAKKALDIRPNNADAADTLAQVYIAKDDFKSARALYDKVFVNDVRNDEVVVHFIALLMKMDDKILAERRFKERQWASESAKQTASQLVSAE